MYILYNMRLLARLIWPSSFFDFNKRMCYFVMQHEVCNVTSNCSEWVEEWSPSIREQKVEVTFRKLLTNKGQLVVKCTLGLLASDFPGLAHICFNILITITQFQSFLSAPVQLVVFSPHLSVCGLILPAVWSFYFYVHIELCLGSLHK